MSRASSFASPSPADPRVITLLSEIVAELRALRSILESRLDDLGAQSNGAAAVDETKNAKRDALMTATELAELLRVDQRTLREMRNAGRTPAPIMIGRSPRWRRPEVEAWLSKGVRR